MLYSAAFDASLTASGTLTVGTSGHSNAVVTLTSLTGTGFGGASTSTMMHALDSSMTCTSEDGQAQVAVPHVAAQNFAYILQTAVRAAATTAGWGLDALDISIDWASATGLFTYQYTAAFTLTWSLAAGRALCGVSANKSGSTFYQGDVVPTYVIVPTLLATSEQTPNYEPAGIANHMRADAGGGYGVSRFGSAVCRDWLQQWETKAKSIAESAASTHPWTFEHLYKHCRGLYPFMVLDGFGESYYEIFSFRSEGTQSHPDYGSPQNATAYHHPFRCWVEGRVG